MCTWANGYCCKKIDIMMRRFALMPLGQASTPPCYG